MAVASRQLSLPRGTHGHDIMFLCGLRLGVSAWSRSALFKLCPCLSGISLYCASCYWVDFCSIFLHRNNVISYSCRLDALADTTQVIDEISSIIAGNRLNIPKLLHYSPPPLNRYIIVSQKWFYKSLACVGPFLQFEWRNDGSEQFGSLYRFG